MVRYALRVCKDGKIFGLPEDTQGWHAINANLVHSRSSDHEVAKWLASILL